MLGGGVVNDWKDLVLKMLKDAGTGPGVDEVLVVTLAKENSRLLNPMPEAGRSLVNVFPIGILGAGACCFTIGLVAKRRARSRVSRQRLRPDLQAGKSSGLAKEGPGQMFMHGTTIKYWLAEGSKVVNSDRGEDRESESGRTAELESWQ